MTKLGNQTVVIERTVDDWDHRDSFGNPTKVREWHEIRWCSFTPTRASEDQSRTSPAIVGATLLAPPGTARDAEAADAILYPWTRGEDGSYIGRRWEVIGEVGAWEEATEAQLRRLL